MSRDDFFSYVAILCLVATSLCITFLTINKFIFEHEIDCYCGDYLNDGEFFN